MFPDLAAFQPPIEFLEELGAIDVPIDEGFKDDDRGFDPVISSDQNIFQRFYSSTDI